ISYHFRGKEELMEQVVIQTYNAIAEHVIAKMTGLESATDLLRTHILSVAEHMRGHRSQLLALGEIFHNLRDADGQPRFGVHTNEELYQAMETVYRSGQESGEFRRFDTRVMAVAHSSSLDSMFAYWVVHPEHDLDAHARELADLFVAAAVAR
ncbi:MAG: TetR/AcrR family transcriptional regulator, partial [Nonomuraea sp.]|nr:TetR/AcrR family transcriptional regulator [Nonomuraea sp.]